MLIWVQSEEKQKQLRTGFFPWGKKKQTLALLLVRLENKAIFKILISGMFNWNGESEHFQGGFSYK